MLELVDTRPDTRVQESEYVRLLGYPPRHTLEGRARELLEWARQWYDAHGRPWIYARQIDGLERTAEGVRVNGAAFDSAQLRDQLDAAQAHSGVLVAVSAGSQCEEYARRLWEEGKPDEYFFMEIFGSAVVEHLVTIAGGRLCAWAEPGGMAVLPHYSPGYSGWSISDQNTLWQLIRRNATHEFPEALHVMETGMLRPKKSLLALFGLSRHLDKVRNLASLVPCESCSLPRCQYRRAPYQSARPPLEDVRRLQPARIEVPDPGPSDPWQLQPEARHTVNARALRKWSAERLRLIFGRDHSVEASFRYEGTTCSNLGRPLAFDYHLRLGPPQDGYRILEARCLPVSGDTGYQHMCAYLSAAESLMRSIAEEKPLLGHPLNDVLAWHRPSSPAGCYCETASRMHKWGLVLEVLHYALVQHETEIRNRGQAPANLQSIFDPL